MDSDQQLLRTAAKPTYLVSLQTWRTTQPSASNKPAQERGHRLLRRLEDRVWDSLVRCALTGNAQPGEERAEGAPGHPELERAVRLDAWLARRNR